MLSTFTFMKSLEHWEEPRQLIPREYVVEARV